MTRHAAHLLALLATTGFALAAMSPLGAAERPGGGGMRQPPLQPPPGVADRNRGPNPDSFEPLPGISGITGSRIRSPEPQPSSPISITHRGTRYLVSGGQWYERRGGDLVAVVPPEGVLVKDLPDGHSMRWIGGVPYFYADGVYYVWRERPRRYEILSAPPVEAAPPAGNRPEAGR